jgi:hypothetical protein
VVLLKRQRNEHRRTSSDLVNRQLLFFCRADK